MTDEPQAVLEPLSDAAIFLVMTFEPAAADAVRDVLADVSGLRRGVGFRIPDGRLSCVVGIGERAWEALFGAPRPARLHTLPVISGAKHTAPSTPGDLLFHIRASRLDGCFELAQQIVARLAGLAEVVDEVHGFRSFDERDLLGFVDGTENPEGDAARAAVQVGDDPAFAGGSYVVVQRYLHDLASWDRVPVEEQERIVGRTKLNDVELPEEEAPASHVALNTIVSADGEEREVLRFNMPFGKIGEGEFGTYFIAYARDPEVIEEMLTNMFVGRPPGTYDRILDFSRAVTGSLFFVPTTDFLDDPPAPGGGAATTATCEDAPMDGSLGIGSLR